MNFPSIIYLRGGRFATLRFDVFLDNRYGSTTFSTTNNKHDSKAQEILLGLLMLLE